MPALGVIGNGPSGVFIPGQEQSRAVGSLKGTLWRHGVLAPVLSLYTGMAGEGGKHHRETYQERLCAPKLATRPGRFSCLLPKWKIGRE